MTDVAAFVLARLAEDEQAARAATGAEWRWVDPGLHKVKSALVDDAGQYVVLAAGADVYPSVADADHIARHDPARVLAEVAAKRALLAWLDELDEYMTERNLWDRPDTSTPRKIMAQPYADHPDYDPAWA